MAAINAQKRKRANNSSSTSVTAPRRSIKKHRQAEPSAEPITERHAKPSFTAPKNPQATLQGLPTELRLVVYDFACESSIIHVHRHTNHENGSNRFTWTPCRSPSPISPLHCANPKWSGMCEEEERCTYKICAPAEHRGFWALAASNKTIRNEAKEFFVRRTVVSIHPKDLQSWLSHSTQCQIDRLRRITLAGPNTPHTITSIDLQALRDRVPNLEAVGFQCQDSGWRWVRSYANDTVHVDAGAWKGWNIVNWMRSFNPSVTIALEAIIWQRHHKSTTSNIAEQQIAIRIIRKGRSPEAGAVVASSGDTIWQHEEIEVDVHTPGRLVAYGWNAHWRQWWHGKEVQGLA